MKAKELAQILGCQLLGNENVEINSISEIQNAEEGDLTFLTNPKYKKYLEKTKASAIIVEKPIKGLEITQLICEEPYVAFAKALSIFYPEDLPSPHISPKATISASAKVGNNCYIGDNVVIEENAVIGDNVILFPGVYIGKNSKVGDNSVIFPNVVIYHNVKIGNWVRIHAGSVVGSDGFGYAFSKKEMKVFKVPQTGGVVIEDFVEIGANTTIDRGTIGDTVIGEGTKIDNLVQIGHNVKIGKYCFIVSQVGISGSTKIGDFVTLAGKVGVAGHIEIASNVTVGAKSGVTKSIKEPGVYAGFPVKPYREWRKIQALVDRLPEIYEKIKRFLGNF
ncbi:UDP-3-O-[3-hydroxymyristoyl] glucosamine N-acyltransferase [Desulfurobacterium pacificum]|uniref:UDP-3-O-acylglucosamine N-acyltransferase n=1 Tax=Desulfurobacterium pacificum TaxID=240166 RepID=A0ABY1N7U8_9BACT|nr:UDP-3-O-(3-hydroxymyristoyl)glucosamine N-acyltransferase [Desulfurobacterium pacificum]SMP02765.1 UDP-3-O-[3-hydroxymyristoyl] glucosamine N-acyltransferase [Desulfurobacterium pacificum]